MAYCNAEDVQDLDLGLDFRQKVADYINSIVERAQADAWDDGYKVGRENKTDLNMGFLNPYK